MSLLSTARLLAGGALAAALSLSCGDSAETGAGGQAGAAGAGGGGEHKLVELRLVEPGPDGVTPVEGVIVAAESEGRRVERITGPAGYAHIFVPYTEGAAFDWIAAKRGHVVVAAVGIDLDDPGLDVEQEVFLPSLTPPDDPVLSVRVSAANVPIGGSYCVGYGAWLMECSSGVELLTVAVPQSLVQDQLVAMARNDAGEPIEMVVVTIQGDGASRTASVVFDGSSEVSPLTNAYRLEIPGEPESPFRTTDLDPDWSGYLVGVEADTFLVRSATHGFEPGPGGEAYNLRFTEFPPSSGSLTYAMAVYADFMAPIRSFRWFANKPSPGSLTFLDASRLSTVGATYRDDFELTEAPGADSYHLVFSDGSGRTVARLQAPPGAPARLPDLPEAYTAGLDFPSAGDAGFVQVIATQGPAPSAVLLDMLRSSDDFAANAQASWGPREAISF
ncbi:MAG: hypothetical protein JRI23_16785 [Deltaproteobacteria bacterium]|nr:hypothetical protein [Deltaproteobacteria bacterium]MBW2533451.1 hypothetical protein [Deltaproteobacteria bacterium]